MRPADTLAFRNSRSLRASAVHEFMERSCFHPGETSFRACLIGELPGFAQT